MESWSVKYVESPEYFYLLKVSHKYPCLICMISNSNGSKPFDLTSCISKKVTSYNTGDSAVLFLSILTRMCANIDLAANEAMQHFSRGFPV